MRALPAPSRPKRAHLARRTTEIVAPSSRTVLFDLDGTLADTAPDLGHALNALLAEHGLAPLAPENVRRTASHGAIAMLRAGFPLLPDEELPLLRERFLEHYRANIARHTRLFPGTATLLDRLEASGLRWGVVTNKLEYLTRPLLLALGLLERADCVVCGDTTAHAKPHPEPLLHACRLLGVAPAASVYVGDSRQDVEAARGAGMPCIIAAYGYLDGGAAADAFGAEMIIDEPLGLLDWAGLGALHR
jgi:phosphoglycolate phosphatase